MGAINTKVLAVLVGTEGAQTIIFCAALIYKNKKLIEKMALKSIRLAV